MSELLDPTPELPDDTLIEDVRFATRIRNALHAAGWKTVGEVPRERRQPTGLRPRSARRVTGPP